MSPIRPLLCLVLVSLFSPLTANATGPISDTSSYWGSAIESQGTSLRTTLHELIKNHVVIPYDSSGFDVHTAIDYLDEDPLDANRVSLLYADTSALKSSWPQYNREHLWPQSLGCGEGSPAHSDLHHIFAVDASVNSARGNLPFHHCEGECVGHSESPHALSNGLVWEPPESDRGDIARSLFYMDLRYEGSDGEPNLVLHDDLVTPGCDCMGLLTTLIAWHQQDPVDDRERLRNERIYQLQGNRNPFVDNPEWVTTIWSHELSEDGDSPWINELHYDNVGADLNEGFEVAGTAGIDLTGWSVALYNGASGTMYANVELAGVIDDEGAGYGALWFAVPGLQNGAADGLALVDSFGSVHGFWSYEGEIDAIDGPALGLQSQDLGLWEDQAPVNHSLQRQGTGSAEEDFSWAVLAPASPGDLNDGQVLVRMPGQDLMTTVVESVATEDGTLVSLPGSPTASWLDATSDLLRVGHDARGREYQSILSFDVSAIPEDAEIVAVTLVLRGVSQSVWGSAPPIVVEGGGLPLGDGIAFNAMDWRSGGRVLGTRLPAFTGEETFSVDLSEQVDSAAMSSSRIQWRLRVRPNPRSDGHALYRMVSGNRDLPDWRPTLVIAWR